MRYWRSRGGGGLRGGGDLGVWTTALLVDTSQ